FQKAESDLDYIQHRLEFEILKSLPENPAEEENPVALLQELSVVKSRYKTLCMQLEKVSVEQRESMKGIRAALENTTKMVQALQQRTDLEHLPLSEEEQTAAQQLACESGKEKKSLVKEPCCSGSTVCDSTEETDIRYPVLLNSLLLSYRAALNVSQMNEMNMKATDSRTRILKELAIVELDKQGNVKFVV
ncbi:PREDICTED: spindle and kinetochore-associated protein 2, partial [Tauraco erythrolophus]|uniref:spindle and kinetochore-associated protein 2 n=1 Tax=Tauraco erythrolophus TaxID=121530 RepID=UPI0005231000